MSWKRLISDKNQRFRERSRGWGSSNTYTEQQQMFYNISDVGLYSFFFFAYKSSHNKLLK